MANKRNRRIRIKRTKKSRQKHSPKISPRKIRIKRRVLVPRTAKQFAGLPRQTQDRWIRITQAISKMRSDRVSLREASRELDLDPSVLTRLGKSALRKRKNGKYVAKPADNLLRILVIPTPEGTREVPIGNSEQASLLGQYWDAVQRYLQTGDTSGLEKFKRKRIALADGKRIQLITDQEQLSKLGHAGVLSFESLYAGVR
jgi:hypothetical protein